MRKPRQLIDLTAPINLNWGQDLTLPPDWRNLIAYSDWLLLTDRFIVIGCLLIDSLKTYRSMIVRYQRCLLLDVEILIPRNALPAKGSQSM